MSSFQRIAALFGVFVLTMGGIVGASAQTTTDTVSVTLGGGVLTFTIDASNTVSTLRYTHENGYESGSIGTFTVSVSDNRNTGDGYSINLSASSFTRAGGGAIVLGGGETNATLAVSAPQEVQRTGGDPINLPTGRAVPNLTGTAQTILSADREKGNGAYIARDYGLSLSGVSAAIPGGTYTSTLTLSSPSAP